MTLRTKFCLLFPTLSKAFFSMLSILKKNPFHFFSCFVSHVMVMLARNICYILLSFFHSFFFFLLEKWQCCSCPLSSLHTIFPVTLWAAPSTVLVDMVTDERAKTESLTLGFRLWGGELSKVSMSEMYNTWGCSFT